MKRWAAGPFLACLLLVLGCGRAQQAEEASSRAPRGRFEMPTRWASLSLPTEGVVKVDAASDEHGLYVDYRGKDRQMLLEDVSRRLIAAGYVRSCSAEDGYVVGFTKGPDQLAVKVDQVGVLALSIFDERGLDPILHGLCFGKYRAGPSHTLDAKEKEELFRRLDADAPSSSPTP
jgi:hypothetical protein